MANGAIKLIFNRTRLGLTILTALLVVQTLACVRVSHREGRCEDCRASGMYYDWASDYCTSDVELTIPQPPFMDRHSSSVKLIFFTNTLSFIILLVLFSKGR